MKVLGVAVGLALGLAVVSANAIDVAKLTHIAAIF